jgi:hypothetical protein
LKSMWQRTFRIRCSRLWHCNHTDPSPLPSCGSEWSLSKQPSYLTWSHLYPTHCWPWTWRHHITLKCLYLSSWLHCVTTQKTIILRYVIFPALTLRVVSLLRKARIPFLRVASLSTTV